MKNGAWPLSCVDLLRRLRDGEKERWRTRPNPAATQPDLWIATSDPAETAGHAIYDRLNSVLAVAKFDRFIEERCARYYAAGQGRPSIAPGVYMRTLLVGFLEGIDSERGITRRCADALSQRSFSASR